MVIREGGVNESYKISSLKENELDLKHYQTELVQDLAKIMWSLEYY
jgi:hypothetical protein